MRKCTNDQEGGPRKWIRTLPPRMKFKPANSSPSKGEHGVHKGEHSSLPSCPDHVVQTRCRSDGLLMSWVWRKCCGAVGEMCLTSVSSWEPSSAAGFSVWRNLSSDIVKTKLCWVKVMGIQGTLLTSHLRARQEAWDFYLSRTWKRLHSTFPDAGSLGIKTPGRLSLSLCPTARYPGLCHLLHSLSFLSHLQPHGLHPLGVRGSTTPRSCPLGSWGNSEKCKLKCKGREQQSIEMI